MIVDLYFVVSKIDVRSSVLKINSVVNCYMPFENKFLLTITQGFLLRKESKLLQQCNVAGKIRRILILLLKTVNLNFLF